MNHVPGPWLVQGKTIKSDYDRQRYTVARVDNPKFTEEANEASRRLIAAAPDMLQALQACLLRDDVASDELGAMIRHTIDKATGEQ